MLTENKMIYDLWEHLRSHISDNDDIDERWLYLQIVTRRAAVLEKKFEKESFISEDFVQDLGCVELENVDAAECGCGDLGSGCYIKRTKLELPRTVIWGGKPAFTHVGVVQKDLPRVSLVTYSRAIHSGYGVSNEKSVFAFPMNNRMYFLARKKTIPFMGLKYANIRGVFVDPSEVLPFTKCTGGYCYSADDTFPINEAIWDIIKLDILKNSGLVKNNAPVDNVNDQKYKPDGNNKA